ncbi:hypothetical protein AB1207_01230 [Kineococcus endophyticus]|uniref:Uncharacterized protein n=1 Tax=Kineococcus endophyticus TaxID=1181883 RepID=A0ABV3P175_9ACTN
MDRPTTTAAELTVTRTECPPWCAHDDNCEQGAFKGRWLRVPATADYVTVDADGAHFPIVEFRAGHDVDENEPHVWLTLAATENGVVAMTPAEARVLAMTLLMTCDDIKAAR